MDLKKRAIQLKTDIPAVFLCMKDKGTSCHCKGAGWRNRRLCLITG